MKQKRGGEETKPNGQVYLLSRPVGSSNYRHVC